MSVKKGWATCTNYQQLVCRCHKVFYVFYWHLSNLPTTGSRKSEAADKDHRQHVDVLPRRRVQLGPSDLNPGQPLLIDFIMAKVFLKTGLSRPLYGFILIFLGALVQLSLVYNFQSGKETGKKNLNIVHAMTSLIEKAQRPARIEWQSDPKKPKFVQGFEPGLLGQKVIALPLALPPQS